MKKTIKKQNKKSNNIIIDAKNILTSIILAVIIGLSFLLDKIIINLVNVIQYPLLFTFFYTTTLLGETYIYVWIAVIITAVLLAHRRTIISFVLTLATAGLLEWLIKIIINRPRPFVALNISSTITTKLSSFPSGHSMMFFALIPAMSKNFPKTKIFFWTIAILVGLSRIYLGVHYFSDVVAGAAFGYAIGWIFVKLGEKYEWKY
jgi:undecaprenyl-diphosphatase